MKTLLFSFFFVIIALTESFSQQISSVPRNYYRKDTTYVMNGYSYRCEGKTGNVTLYNVNNKWVKEKQIYKDTGKRFDFGFSKSELDKYNPIIDNADMDQKVLNIVNNAFTRDFSKKLKSYEKLNVVMYLNPQTGKVAEVSFWFISSDPFSTIPISTYRDIEMKLKNQISYKPSEIGKQLNFIMLSLMHKPLGALSAPSKTIAPTK